MDPRRFPSLVTGGNGSPARLVMTLKGKEKKKE
jgi:hypothetical protein